MDQLAKRGQGGYGFYALHLMSAANELAVEAGCADLPYKGVEPLPDTEELFGFEFLKKERSCQKKVGVCTPPCLNHCSDSSS
jgi:hypothetical protein